MDNGFKILLNKQDAGKILRLLIASEIFFLVVYVIMSIVAPQVKWGPFEPLFDLDNESSIPTWFSSAQLVVIATLLWAISRSYSRYRWFYVLGAIVFLFLSIDETVQLHERLSMSANAYDIKALKSIMIGEHGAWILPYILAGLIILFLARKPIIEIYRNHRKPFLYVLIGALVAAVGLIGIEVLSYLGMRESGSELVYSIEVAPEEFFEMIGVSIVLYGIILLGSGLQTTDEKSEN